MFGRKKITAEQKRKLEKQKRHKKRLDDTENLKNTLFRLIKDTGGDYISYENWTESEANIDLVVGELQNYGYKVKIEQKMPPNIYRIIIRWSII